MRPRAPTDAKGVWVVIAALILAAISAHPDSVSFVCKALEPITRSDR
jgi:hypothetical protein